jgi:GTP-binding protein HflX
MWTHLSRTAGGIGTRGPGESQLETDRRIIRDKIRKVRSELDEVKRHRTTAGRQRDRAEVATVALVGYTNAGKSSVLNALAGADVYAADMLFATLDPTSRAVILPSGQRVVVTDTVGFINKLPHDLVDAFRATLEEVVRADLLLEVVDAADPDFIGQQAAVQTVLDELGAGDKPRVTVFNKIDLLDADLRAAPAPASEQVAFVSALTGEGLDGLRQRMADALRAQMVTVDEVLPYERGELAARARAAGDVDQAFTAGGIRLSGHLPAAMAAEVRNAAPRRRAGSGGSSR